MINFNCFHVNIISAVISFFIFLILIFLINIPKGKESTNISNKNEFINDINNEVINFEINKEKIVKWKIEIESLNLEADIKDIEEIVPNKDSIGHFKQTSILGNNIALIAYNFGTEKNYFANLKDLSTGDKIKYIVNDKIITYEVISNKIIEKENLDMILKYNNDSYSLLKLFTYVKGIDDKLRYVLSKRYN